MTGYTSKRQAAQDKLDDDDIQTYQRPWVGLTDEEIRAVNAQVSQILPINYTNTTYARALEAKLKELNHG